MHRALLAAAVATAVLGASAADAATRHKHTRAPRAAHTYVAPAPRYAAPVVPAPQVGPAWSGPNQCWTDEGYGRYAPCDGGGKAF
jgi:hypothetical protein